MNIKLDKVGADVEWFLVNGEGKPVPSIGLIGGTKSDPIPLIPGKTGYMIQEDNVTLEWNIPAAKSRQEFVYYCMRAREAIDEKLNPLALKPAIVPSMHFDAAQLEHPQAKTLGCEPDFNVWERMENPKPDLTGKETLRSAGGHVHISFTVGGETPTFPKNLPQMETIIMASDIWLGLPFVVLDTDKERRQLYGKAGAFRPKPYGVEYRVLSSLWSSDPVLTEFVFSQVENMFHYLSNSQDAHGWLTRQKELVVPAINNGDIAAAQKLMYKYSLQTPR